MVGCLSESARTVIAGYALIRAARLPITFGRAASLRLHFKQITDATDLPRNLASVIAEILQGLVCELRKVDAVP